MDLPKRKQIRLAGYDYSTCGAYFVTICTHNRARLFGEIVGANLCVRPNHPDKIIEKWLLELENKYPGVLIDNHVIMPDHIHFILRQTGEHATKTGEHVGSPLHEIVKWYKTQTTNEYIRGVKNGMYPPFEQHIWQRNYYEHIIRSQDDYDNIWQYIEDNPLNWQQDCIDSPQNIT